jgi:hypothetical protein
VVIADLVHATEALSNLKKTGSIAACPDTSGIRLSDSIRADAQAPALFYVAVWI